MEGDERFGHGEGAQFQDDDDRANFLSGNRSSLLYYWHVAVDHDLLSQTLNILPDDMSVITERTSPVSRQSRNS